VRVLAAIEEVDSGDGVLVLMDLGSALLSAEMALEMLPPEKRSRVQLCEAPMVEGAIAAAVQARLGSSLDLAAAEARRALAAKSDQLGGQLAEPPPSQPLPPSSPESPVQELLLTVAIPLGLHARPAARFVQTVGRFPQATLQVTNQTAGRGPASARSITALAMLGIRQGHEIRIMASGSEAGDALAALQELAAEGFGDRGLAILPAPQAAPVTARPSAPSGGLQGLAASPGIAIGPLHHHRQAITSAIPEITERAARDPEIEWETLLAALEKTRGQIRADMEAALRGAGAYAAAIFEAHLLFLDDEALREPARLAIFTDKINAAAAWQAAFVQAAAQYHTLEDAYLSARATDVEEVGRQVLAHLAGDQTAGSVAAAPASPCILVAPGLALADVARLDPDLVLGVCTAYGSPTSHGAIMLRSLGIPAVFGLGEALLALPEGTRLFLDGETGQVWLNPEEGQVAGLAGRMEAWQSNRATRLAGITARVEGQVTAETTTTLDGRHIEIAANIGSLAEARAAVVAGAEGVGVLRTEFLFLDRQAAPDEEEQYTAYCAIASALQRRPLIIRTLDAGGDKPLPYLDQGQEANPFLGWRAIRICLDQPELFKTQLRAIWRAAADYPIKAMFPMVATVSEWRAGSALLAEARDELQQAGRRIPPRMDTGIMVEIPSTALCAASFAPEVDFFSIGTNDLIQYTLAAERGNLRVASLSDPFHPAVLSLIHRVVMAAHASGKWVGVCGEMAGDPLAAPVLVGLGVDELSMIAASIPAVKKVVQGLDYARLVDPVAGLLSLESAEAVRKAAVAFRSEKET
jgi:phosphocarrier protein FPr